jgi:predicted permease
MKNLMQDFRFALRQMRHSPGFAVTAVLTLALGIAANVIVFGVLQSVILQPLPVPHAEQVKTLGTTVLQFPVLAYPEMREVRDNNTVFAGVAGEQGQVFGMEADGVTRPVMGFEVSGQYFDVFAIQPMLGRLLRPSDDAHPGASDALVLSYSAWKSHFASDPNIVGKIVKINKHPYTIVGVTPAGFLGSLKFLQPEFYLPMSNEASLEGVDWLNQWHEKNIGVVVRIKDGVSLPEAQAQLATIAGRIQRINPAEEEGLGFTLARPGLVGDYVGKPAMRFLAGVMGLAFIVLLAACANLGSLFAARTADRAREISIRMAVGSSRWRILRQVLVEAFVISIFGGICACAISWAALNGLAAWHPPTDYPIQFSVAPQPSLIAMAFLISVLAAVLFGLMPLRQIFKADPNDAIKAGGGQVVSGRRWALRDVLLAGQIALCCVTVTAAFVSLRGMTRALTMDLGFNPRGATLTEFQLSQAGYNAETAAQFQRRLLDKVVALPGVKAAGYANTTPLGDDPDSMGIYTTATTEFKSVNKVFDAMHYSVAPGYLQAAETPLLAGRDFSFDDKPNTPPVAIVNEDFVRRFFHGEPAIGKYFRKSGDAPIQIIGVVANGKYLALGENQQPAVFYAITQALNTATTLIVRGQGGSPDVGALAATVRGVIHDMDPTIPLRQSGSWTDAMALSFFPAEVSTVALSVFGAFGLLLSVAGTFGLASYTVSKRLRELSIRVALGAQGRQILQAALGRMLVLLVCGSVVGIVLGLATSRVLSAIVYHASATDPLVIGLVAMTMIVTGGLAVTGPVRRALHVDPAILLREQ